MSDLEAADQEKKQVALRGIGQLEFSSGVIESLKGITDFVKSVQKVIYQPSFLEPIQRIGVTINKIGLSPEFKSSMQNISQLTDSFARSQEVGKFLSGSFAASNEIGKIAAQFSSSPLIEFFASRQQVDIHKLVSATGTSEIALAAVGEARVIPGSQILLEQEIVQSLQAGAEPEALSPSQRNYLFLFFFYVSALLGALATMNGARQEVCYQQAKWLPGMTANQAGKALRSALCGFPTELLGGLRSVKGDGVRLRTGPSMKAEIIQVSISDRATLEVLDSSDRNWLLVSVIGQEGVEGWISRKYTHVIQ